jgi:hypothetical protein
MTWTSKIEWFLRDNHNLIKRWVKVKTIRNIFLYRFCLADVWIYTQASEKKKEREEEIRYVVRRAGNFSPRKKTACAAAVVGSCSSPVQNTANSKHAGPSMIYPCASLCYLASE